MFVILSLLVFALLAAALMAAAHYLSPRVVGRELHRIEAYVIGSALGIALPFGGWVGMVWLAGETMPDLIPPIGLLIIMVGAGLGTGAGWGLDAWAGQRGELRARRNQDHDKS
jgi:hypothetical protein